MSTGYKVERRTLQPATAWVDGRFYGGDVEARVVMRHGRWVVDNAMDTAKQVAHAASQIVVALGINLRKRRKALNGVDIGGNKRKVYEQVPRKSNVATPAWYDESCRGRPKPMRQWFLEAFDSQRNVWLSAKGMGETARKIGLAIKFARVCKGYRVVFRDGYTGKAAVLDVSAPCRFDLPESEIIDSLQGFLTVLTTEQVLLPHRTRRALLKASKATA